MQQWQVGGALPPLVGVGHLWVLDFPKFCFRGFASAIPPPKWLSNTLEGTRAALTQHTHTHDTLL